MLKEGPGIRLRRALRALRNGTIHYLLPATTELPLFILASPRTGSTLLSDYLNSIPGVAVAGEILNPALDRGLSRRITSKSIKRRHIERSLNALRRPIAGAKFLMFHLVIHGISLDDMREWFPTARFLVLFRESAIEQYVSIKVAELTNVWVGRGKTRRFNGKIRVDPADYLEWHATIRQRYRDFLSHSWLQSAGRILRYEELARTPQEVFDKDVFPLLGLPSANVTTGMRKQSDRDVSSLIANYDEVARVIASHGTWGFAFERQSADGRLANANRTMESETRYPGPS